MHRESAVPEYVHRGRLKEVVPARGGHDRPELKGSIGEGPNHSNHFEPFEPFEFFQNRNFPEFSLENSRISENFNIF